MNNNKEVVKRFFTCLEEGNAKAVAELFSEEGVHINPYASGLFPEGTSGRRAIETYWQGPIDNFESMRFPLEEVYSMKETAMVFVKFKGHVVLKDQSVYSNDYYATFKFNENHEITEYVEIFNAIVAARGFGLLNQIK